MKNSKKILENNNTQFPDENEDEEEDYKFDDNEENSIYYEQKIHAYIL